MEGFKTLLLIGTYAYLAIIFFWTAGALFFDAGARTKKGYLLVAIWIAVFSACLMFVKPIWVAVLLVSAMVGAVVTWWLTQKPSHDHVWDPNFEMLPQFVIDGDQLTVHNLRNTTYRSLEEYDCRYETREYDLSKLQALDLLILYWGSTLVSHPMLIFDFGNRHLCFSIEVRYRAGEDYDMFRSLYRQNELMYVVSDERDAILRRTKYSAGQDCYLYRLQATLDENREVLQEYVDAANSIIDTPRWYNAVSANCTTTIYRQRRGKMAWDWRILINGSFDKLLYERERLFQGLPFDELRNSSRVNDRANSADLESFSSGIRNGMPGFTEFQD